MKRPERGAYLYARVKATMILRTPGDPPRHSGLRHRRFRLPVVLAGAAAVLLTMLAGGSGAGISAYQGTLYLDGAPSSVASSSFQVLTSVGPATPGAPVATAGLTGSGTIPAGNYLYIAVADSGGARSASAVSNQVAVPANGSVSLANVPVGSLVYRVQLVTTTTSYKLVSPAGGTTAAPFVDDGSGSSTVVLPQADNRAASIGSPTGYAPFTPGTIYPTTTAVNSSLTPSATAPATCSGWIVDSSGGLSFPAGTWTFQARVKSGAIGVSSAAAVLTAALYKTNSSGALIGTMVPPTDGSGNMINAGGTTNTFTVSATTSSSFTLGTGEHLCIQFWRHQTTGYTGGGASARTLTMLAYDSANQVSLHPAPNAFATAALSSPADGFHAQTAPALGATYSDTEGDAGNLTIKLCSDSACATQLQTSGSMAANNGDTKTWTPAALADGTYYWAAQAQDGIGLPSAWTSTRSFVIDNVAPTTSIDSGPPANSSGSSGTIAFSANEGVTGFQCRVDAGSWGACTSPYSYGPLADGSHTFEVKASADLAGNAGTTTSYGWTIDTVPPNTSMTSQPSSLSNSASPSFSLSATEVGSTFDCELDGGGFASCSSPKSYSGVADGAHTFQVRAVDPAGNADASPASYSWTIDATPPDTSIGPSYPFSLTTATGATFDFSSTEGGSTFACSLDGSAFTSCSTPKTYSALADGSHTFQVRATDAATNTDPTPASYTWTIDTTPPVTTIGPTTPPANTPSTSATFDLGSNEPGSTFECRLAGGAYAACTTPKTYTGLTDGSHIFDVRATDPAGNVDTSPATYIWSIDNVAPSTPTLVSPADATLTNALPQLRARFDDATAGGDTGTLQFQVCSGSSPAGTACAPVVQSTTSGALPSGGTGSWTTAALPDGTYNWQARAQDAAGNLSGWSATRSFQIDTAVPTTTLDSPADNATPRSVELRATYSEPSFAVTGTVEFRICSDALCLGVVRSGSSATLANGAQAAWSPMPALADGLWYWQVRSVDAAGNASAWSPVRILHVDTVAPKAPRLGGDVGADGLTLHIGAPDDSVANYVLYVDGVAAMNLATTETDVNMGPFDENDVRTFSVLAIDTAGNVGAMSRVLVGVPNLVGLDWTHASSATSARGLGLQRDAVAFGSIPMFVTSQTPSVPAVMEQGSPVKVTMAAAAGSPLAVRVRPGAVSCRRTCVLRLRIELSSSALVRSRLVGGSGRVLKRNLLGTLHAGANTVRVRLPQRLAKGPYRLFFDASGDGGTAHAYVRVKVS
jgi:Bacterial Ig-like domain